MRVPIMQNFDNDGDVVFGLIKKRNLVEAGIFALIVFVIGKITFKVFPHLFVAAVFIIIGILGVCLLLVGIDDQSIGTIIMNSMSYKKTKRKVSLQPPSDVKHL